MSFLDRPSFDGLENSGRVPELNRSAKTTLIPDKPNYGIEGDDRFSRQAISGLHAKTKLNQAFFSEDNINYIQDELRYSVHQKTGIVIDNQSVDELRIIMRGIYLQEFPYTPGNEADDIRELNKKVLAFSVDQVSNAVLHHKKFLNDLKNPLKHMDRPLYASGSGTKGSYDINNVKFF
jgi:hypothetical protein